MNEQNDQLDAYGHMNWCVGNEDWTACFDAVRIADGIAYHVVVDCESGGFVDTIEKGIVPATPEGIANLLSLPRRYADMCGEMYNNDPCLTRPDEDGNIAYEYGPIEWEQCDEQWRQHLQSLLTATPPDENDEDHSDEQSLDYFNRYIAGDR